MDDIKRIDLKEFVEHGYLQEVNRQFFHPLGLALEVVVDDDGSVTLGGVWDCRDDLEGVTFAAGVIDGDKAMRVAAELDHRRVARVKRLGGMVQPLGMVVPEGS